MCRGKAAIPPQPSQLATRHSPFDTHMVPWPLALLTLFYGVIAAISAATVWKVTTGVLDRPLLWPLVWLAGSVGVICGLPLLKPWARWLAVLGSWVFVFITLSIGGLLARASHPVAALLATGGAAIHLVIIRYLSRPSVKAYFVPGGGCEVSGEREIGEPRHPHTSHFTPNL